VSLIPTYNAFIYEIQLINMSEKEIAWDLSEVFTSCDDPKISITMDALMDKADQMINQYKGKINISAFKAQNLYDILTQYEYILDHTRELASYSANSFNANRSLPETKSLWNKLLIFRSSIFEKLAFIELELGKFLNLEPELINEKILSTYTHYLKKIMRKFPYKLTEAEEQLILEKDQFGLWAWQQLRSTWIITRKCKATVEGKEREILRSEVFPLLQHPDRKTRMSVSKSVYTLLSKDEEIYSSAFRNVCGNWVKNMKRRKYVNHIQQSLIDNDISQEIIDNLMKTVEDNINLYQKFCTVKAKIFNLPKLTGVDQRAYFPSEKKYTWDEIKKITHQTYENFDIKFGEIVSDMFKRNHIDASTREGKTDFVYCNHWYRGKSAFILTRFSGLSSDIGPLTHELGHAIHYYLASREQKYLNFMPGSVIAETASMFGVLLLIDHLLEKSEPNTEKIALLTNHLNGAGFAIFNFSARMWFEQIIYDAIEKGVYLDGRTISNYWCTARDKIYGDSVEWSDDMKWDWINMSYFLHPENRFMNYPYVFAQLFVYALYQTYKKEGETFVAKFKKLLGSGCSQSPEELSKIVGLDITTPEVWNLGMKQYESFVNELERLRG